MYLDEFGILFLYQNLSLSKISRKMVAHALEKMRERDEETLENTKNTPQNKIICAAHDNSVHIFNGVFTFR